MPPWPIRWYFNFGGLAAARVLKRTQMEMAVLYMSGYPLQMVEEASKSKAFLRKLTPEALTQKVRDILLTSIA